MIERLQTWGTVTVYEPTYCEAFFLIARGASDTLNQEEPVTRKRKSKDEDEDFDE